MTTSWSYMMKGWSCEITSNGSCKIWTINCGCTDVANTGSFTIDGQDYADRNCKSRDCMDRMSS